MSLGFNFNKLLPSGEDVKDVLSYLADLGSSLKTFILQVIKHKHTGDKNDAEKVDFSDIDNSAHPVLGSTYHNDTLTGAVVRGDFIYGNATPKWARLAKGTQAYTLVAGAFEPEYVLPDLLSAYHADVSAGSVVKGDLIHGSGTPKWARLPGNTTTTKKFLVQTGTGAISDIPAWDTIVNADLPSIVDADVNASAAIATTKLGTGAVVQVVNTLNVTKSTGTTVTPIDDTIPQVSEVDLVAGMQTTITPKSTTNKLWIHAVIQCANSAVTGILFSLFQDAGTPALNVSYTYQSTAGGGCTIVLDHYMAAGTTSATTFKFGASGIGAGTTTVNGLGGARYFGGVLTSSVTITEIAV